MRQRYEVCVSPEQSLPFKGGTCCPRQAGTARWSPGGSPALGTPREQVPGTWDRNATTCCYRTCPPLAQAFFPRSLRAAQLPTLSLWPRCKTLGTLCGSEVPGGGMCVSVCVFTPSKTWVQGLSDSRTFSPSAYHRTQRIPQTQSPPGREPSLTSLHPPNPCSISTTRGPG